ncbi:pilin [Aeromonas veronii]|nr:pilin [Aeromonas veronii]
MIVVAIIAILAAVALPAYQNYTAKAKATAVLAEAASYKTAVALCYQTTSALPGCSANSNGIPAVAGNVSSVTDGVISMTIPLGSVSNATVTLTPSASTATIKWIIESTEASCPNYIAGCNE